MQPHGDTLYPGDLSLPLPPSTRPPRATGLIPHQHKCGRDTHSNPAAPPAHPSGKVVHVHLLITLRQEQLYLIRGPQRPHHGPGRVRWRGCPGGPGGLGRGGPPYLRPRLLGLGGASSRRASWPYRGRAQGRCLSTPGDSVVVAALATVTFPAPTTSSAPATASVARWGTATVNLPPPATTSTSATAGAVDLAPALAPRLAVAVAAAATTNMMASWGCCPAAPLALVPVARWGPAFLGRRALAARMAPALMLSWGPALVASMAVATCVALARMALALAVCWGPALVASLAVATRVALARMALALAVYLVRGGRSRVFMGGGG